MIKHILLFMFLLNIHTLASAQQNTVSLNDEQTKIAEGYEIVVNRKLGNCLACHVIQGEEGPGYFGPPLLAMQARFPNRQDLYDQIWDATTKNKLTSMPPFGKHMILTDEQIDKIVSYLLTL